MRNFKLCSEIHGGNCKNKVSARKNYACAAGHLNVDIAQARDRLASMAVPDKLKLAESPYLDTATIKALCQDRHHLEIASKNRLNPLLEQAMSKDRDWEVRAMIAAHTNNEQLQLVLAKDKAKNVRGYLSHNPNLCQEAQILLTKDSSSGVLAEFAKEGAMSLETAAIMLSQSYCLINFMSGKPFEALLSSDLLTLMKTYPRPMSRSYLEMLLSDRNELDKEVDRDNKKALVLHSYNIYKQENPPLLASYKKKVLDLYKGDQEVEFFLED